MLLEELRWADGAYILERLAEGGCCAVVGISNTGKSSLLRGLARPEIRQRHEAARADDRAYVYVDLNLMLEATEQGFYELILRCLVEEASRLAPVAEFLPRLQRAYRTLVDPPSAFQVSLSFSEGMTAVCQNLPRPLVLLLDEFDEPFDQIEGRAFLNLRALKDKYPERLSFVTTTNHRLSTIRRGRDVDEFVELFEPFTHFLSPLVAAATQQLITWVAAQGGYTFGDKDCAFIDHQAGGHVGLLLAIGRALGEVTGDTVRDEGQDWLIHRQVREQLDREVNVQAECRKLWDDLTEEQQDTLISVVGTEENLDPRTLESLRLNGLVQKGEEMLFSPVFEAFVRRQRLTRRRRQEGVRVDVESGSVWVDGRPTPTLTDLEYRLLLLLYGRLNKICDKYEIVEAVWGEEYIDQVDDARIDKLVSRLRAKIEPDPSSPHYLVTVRGRGYRLSTP